MCPKKGKDVENWPDFLLILIGFFHFYFSGGKMQESVCETLFFRKNNFYIFTCCCDFTFFPCKNFRQIWPKTEGNNFFWARFSSESYKNLTVSDTFPTLKHLKWTDFCQILISFWSFSLHFLMRIWHVSNANRNLKLKNQKKIYFTSQAIHFFI